MRSRRVMVPEGTTIDGMDVEGGEELELRLEPAGDGRSATVHLGDLRVHVEGDAVARPQAGGWFRLDDRIVRYHVHEEDGRVRVWVHGHLYDVPLAERRARRGGDTGGAGGGDEVVAPMPGTVLEVRVAAGDRFAAGDVLVVMESMKMEMNLVAPRDGEVAEVLHAAGTQVDMEAVIVRMAPLEAGGGGD